jgi:hypothetical protein
VVDELGRAKLVYEVDVAPALDFIDEAADKGLILFGHESSPDAHFPAAHDTGRPTTMPNFLEDPFFAVGWMWLLADVY